MIKLDETRWDILSENISRQWIFDSSSESGWLSFSYIKIYNKQMLAQLQCFMHFTEYILPVHSAKL